MTDKAVVLIDGGYFDNINDYAQTAFDSEIDFDEFSNGLCRAFGCELLRAKFYHSMPYQSDDPDESEKAYYSSRQSWFDAIDNKHNHQFEKTGRVRQEHANCPECGEDFTEPRQKGVDVGIAVDLVDMANHQQADAFILVTGDEDLTHAVESAKEQLCNVYLAFAHERSAGLKVSRKLSREADNAINLAEGEFLRDCLMD